VGASLSPERPGVEVSRESTCGRSARRIGGTTPNISKRLSVTGERGKRVCGETRGVRHISSPRSKEKREGPRARNPLKNSWLFRGIALRLLPYWGSEHLLPGSRSNKGTRLALQSTMKKKASWRSRRRRPGEKIQISHPFRIREESYSGIPPLRTILETFQEEKSLDASRTARKRP